MKKCNYCNGSGTVMYFPGIGTSFKMRCKKCHGKGMK